MEQLYCKLVNFVYPIKNPSRIFSTRDFLLSCIGLIISIVGQIFFPVDKIFFAVVFVCINVYFISVFVILVVCHQKFYGINIVVIVYAI